MSAISRSLHTNPLSGARYAGTPLVSTPLISIQSKYKYHRMRDMLRNALSGANGRDLFATPATQGAQPSAGLFSAHTDAGGGIGLGSDGFDVSLSRRGSMAPTRQMVPSGGSSSRKPSISSAGAL
jgi:SAGA-associated factor 73